MSKIKDWMLEQKELASEAMMMGMRDKEILEYVKDNMRGQPIDSKMILEFLRTGEDYD